jgi:chromosome segregation ATPase
LVRDATRLEENLDEVRGELENAMTRLGEFSAEEKKRLQGEVAFFKRKSAAIEEKLAKATDRTKSLENDLHDAQTATPVAPTAPEVTDEDIAERIATVKQRLAADLEDVTAIFQQWRSNFALFKTYLKEVDQTIEAIADSEQEALPVALREAVAIANPVEAIESVHDLLRLVDTDAKALKKGLGRFKKELGSAAPKPRENDG